MIKYTLFAFACKQQIFVIYLEKQLSKRNVATRLCLWWGTMLRIHRGKGRSLRILLSLEEEKKIKIKHQLQESQRPAVSQRKKVDFRTCLQKKKKHVHLVRSLLLDTYNPDIVVCGRQYLVISLRIPPVPHHIL